MLSDETVNRKKVSLLILFRYPKGHFLAPQIQFRALQDYQTQVIYVFGFWVKILNHERKFYYFDFLEIYTKLIYLKNEFQHVLPLKTSLGPLGGVLAAGTLETPAKVLT
ncbi:UNKNOWN [Stylonychia lemnae]|uniref:Uncharacterized protein n=1 Tax=Stylonychia lemnae TaxID=5949 RepID=A0A078B3Y0_STYLE|nr:UNKNOWN [Stylonychia lemnae]|eukprot:CDW88936.1 UNKNOWN [Stylonychia lemnae]